MIAPFRVLAGKAIEAVTSIRRVPIDRCYHYRGFRYGGHGNNPYEDFILGLASGRDLAALRGEFAWRALNCRPRSMGAALQIEIGDWPLWEYPWSSRPALSRYEKYSLCDNPDVMCHFPSVGVLASQINREFGWLEGAWQSISTVGYQPRRFGYVRCIELETQAQSSYLVLDGNHRVSSMHAASVRSVEVELLYFRRVRRSRAAAWPRVRDGSMELGHAQRVFDRYFADQNPPLVPENPATLHMDEPALWPIIGQDRISGRVTDQTDTEARL